VAEGQEDRSLMGIPFSNGDEPYIVMYGYSSRLGRSGSTSVVVNKYEDRDWGEGIREGQQKEIPAAMGTLDFEGVAGDGVIGAVIVIFESDRTPWAIMRRRIDNVKKVVQENVARQVENRRNIDFESMTFLDGLHRSLQDAVLQLSQSGSTGEAVENFVFSTVDTDEVIGVNSIVLMRSPPTESLVLPHYNFYRLTDRLSTRDFDAPLIFENAELNARYEVSISIAQK
jgi:hypothetical protein